MGKVYKDKKSKGCALCKPHKHGWDPKKKGKVVAVETEIITARDMHRRERLRYEKK